MNVTVGDNIAGISAPQWDALGGAGGPFTRHAWLAALEASGAVGRDTGWQPLPLTAEQHGRLVAAAPAYLKSHSWGEYVFDWSWADAFERAGLAYYPKLLVAVPFTPVEGPRLMGDVGLLAAAAETLVAEHHLSSAHVLFPPEAELATLGERGWLVRHGVQFHWQNRGYRDFADFLDALTRDKRKKIRQERRRVVEAGVTVRVLEGAAIGEGDWAGFHRGYVNTYHEYRSTPYLSLDFFRRIGATMAEQLVLFVAERNGEALAYSLCVRDGRALYGRYWGALADVPLLHFELCYYAGIEYAIAAGLAVFEGGAQGEHKQARGFEPERTASAHWIGEASFRQAIERWLARERTSVAGYLAELRNHSAYPDGVTESR
ncbi:GNAT family N-acetyltransferase [Crenobacter sp. SG2303]|uniref:GNAT family N-acetyltransferase n=1 Tax=Crenobacter oryzisoli TaxID=3056844 RepID=A0ABT7XPZ4_9NEIS|nr:GNAT family N-acetyltransferase [Crenobacter sp. SG2303]MDN0075639.1 GNAT family N-acetyltransferase [Crenobacter sp. SG2303]